MRDVGQTVEVSLQDIPAHLIVERVAELWWHLEEEDRKYRLIFASSRPCRVKYH